MIESLTSRLVPGALVLDIGCGTGLQARELALSGCRVAAIDLDFDALSTARELSDPGASPPGFSAARAESLPFPDARFDAVVCLDVFHWAADAAAFRRLWDEAWRVLGRGGLFLVRTRDRDSSPSAVPLGGGRFRLESGAEWFLPARADLDALLFAVGGTWLAPPTAEERGDARDEVQGRATMLARKLA
jgi:SAM-dependent methyltransferase